MKNLLFFFLVLCTIACESGAPISNGTSSQLVEMDSFVLPSLKATISLPKRYFITSVENLQAKVDASDLDSVKKKMMVDAFQRLKSGFSDSYIFSDNEQIENSIWLIEVPSYVKMSSKVAEIYAKRTEQKLLSTWKAMEFEVKRLERKYIDKEGVKGLKLKFKQTLDGESKYQTQYLISSKDKTFMIVVSSLDSNDFQAEIEGIESN